MILYNKDLSFRAYDEARIAKLLSGEARVETWQEKDFLEYVGGVRPKPWPEAWRSCLLCQGEWKATAYPGVKGSWQYATICSDCADRWDAGVHPAQPKWAMEGKGKKAQKNVRSPHND